MIANVDAKQVMEYVIKPALNRLEPHIPFTHSAAQLVLGTGLKESGGFKWIDQRDKLNKPGPAYGFWQMEGPTFSDHFNRLTPGLKQAISGMMMGMPGVRELHGNMYLAAAMCRIVYWHAPEMIPLSGDFVGMCALWKKRYNTPLGAGTEEEALPWFQYACTL